MWTNGKAAETVVLLSLTVCRSKIYTLRAQLGGAEKSSEMAEFGPVNLEGDDTSLGGLYNLALSWLLKVG